MLFMVASHGAWNALPSELRQLLQRISSITVYKLIFFYLNYPLSTKSTVVNIVTINRVFNIFNGFNLLYLQCTNYCITITVLLM